MKKILLLTAVLLLFTSICVPAQSFVKNTYQFSEQSGQKLYLDRYSPIRIMDEPMPCVIFVFGGAFARGARDVEKYVPYFNYLVENGYTVVSIDYRLGLKEAAQNPNLSPDAFAAQFINAVNIAVEDLFDATCYVLNHATEWNIDRNHIVANGSSAGAVTVLQAEYAVCNNLHDVWSKLPADFNYAGIMSFAGGIYIPTGKLQWNNRPCPIMMMHGDADLQVPYNKLMVGDLGLYGANPIAETLEANDYPYYFYHFEDYGHEIASDPMRDNKEDVLWFLNTLVRDKKQYKIRKQQVDIEKEKIRDKNFGFEDFVRGNFIDR